MPSGKSRKTASHCPAGLVDSIEVFSSVYRIEYVDSVYKVCPTDSDNPYLGYVDYSKNLIRIYYEDCRSIPDVWKDIFHELNHIYTKEMGITEISNSKRCEEIIDCLATATVDTLMRNQLGLRSK